MLEIKPGMTTCMEISLTGSLALLFFLSVFVFKRVELGGLEMSHLAMLRETCGSRDQIRVAHMQGNSLTPVLSIYGAPEGIYFC